MVMTSLPAAPPLTRLPSSSSPVASVAHTPCSFKLSDCSSIELRFYHPFSVGVSRLVSNSPVAALTVPELSGRPLHGRNVGRTAHDTGTWNETSSTGSREASAQVECLSPRGFKWSRNEKASRIQSFRCSMEGRPAALHKQKATKPCISYASKLKIRRNYDNGSRMCVLRRRFRCQSAGSEDERDKKTATSVATEEPEDSKTTFPPPDSSDENALPEPIKVEFNLMELIGPEKVDAADVKLLKEKVFGYTTFWVTGQEPFGDLGEGVLLLGNLRGKREEVFSKLQRQLREVTGTKYNLFMVEEPNSEGPDPRGGPRVSFVLLRREVSEPRPTTLWQYVIAFVLFVLTAGSCLELGIASQLSKLPPEVVKYFTNPEVVEPPDLQLLVPYVESAIPLAYGVLGVQLFHEVGHLLAASPKKVKMGIPYFIPNVTLGSFGAITQFKSLIPDRTAKFDISMAGPLAGGLLSFSMLGVGLLLSTTPETIGDLVQVPSMLFQGSLLLGLFSRAVLGYDVMHATTVAIHPLVIVGWCGLTTTAFNLLPVGCLDGGRAMQAAFGKNTLTGFSLITIVLLGFGVLGGPLSLAWGLYILICQRTPEKPCLNDVTEVGSWRQGALAVTVMLVVLTLLPLWDNLAEELGIGLGSPLL